MKKVFWIILFMLLPKIAFGAIGHDASTVNTSSTTTTSCSFTHTAVGTPTLALLWIGQDGDETLTSTPTWGGTNMVLITENACTGAGEEHMWLYELHSPGTGGKTVTAEFTENEHHICIAQTFTGTHATDATVEDDFDDGGCGNVDTVSTTLTMNATTSWMVTAAQWHGGDITITETNFTPRNEGASGAGANADDSYSHGDSTGDVGSLTHTSDGDADENAIQISVELIPAVAAASRRMLISN